MASKSGSKSFVPLSGAHIYSKYDMLWEKTMLDYGNDKTLPWRELEERKVKNKKEGKGAESVGTV